MTRQTRDAVRAFVPDGLGVLNVGAGPIEGAVERVARMRAAGKRVIMLTSAATQPLLGALEEAEARPRSRLRPRGVSTEPHAER